jgi:hypothetical protein
MQALPGIYGHTPFTRKVVLMPSSPIRAMHPKTEIRPDAASISKILGAGWVGQLKIHGHRAQIHVPAAATAPLIAYNRQGKPHKKFLSPAMSAELRRIYAPSKGWNVIDAEWLKPEDKLFVFDFLKRDDVILTRLSYPERYKLLPRAFISPRISTLPLLETLEECLRALQSEQGCVEGLVFKSRTSTGFGDTSIIRCRRRH